MKRLVYSLLSISFFVVLLVSCGQSKSEIKDVVIKDTPIEYNDYIIGQQSKIINKMIELSNTFKSLDAMDMDNKLRELQNQIDSSISEIKKLQTFNGDSNFRQSAMKLFEFYQSIAKQEFSEMVNILKKKENITNQDKIRMDEINRSITDRETVLDKNLFDAQHSFASQHGFAIERNKLQDKIDKIGQ